MKYRKIYVGFPDERVLFGSFSFGKMFVSVNPNLNEYILKTINKFGQREDTSPALYDEFNRPAVTFNIPDVLARLIALGTKKTVYFEHRITTLLKEAIHGAPLEDINKATTSLKKNIALFRSMKVGIPVTLYDEYPKITLTPTLVTKKTVVCGIISLHSVSTIRLYTTLYHFETSFLELIEQPLKEKDPLKEIDLQLLWTNALCIDGTLYTKHPTDSRAEFYQKCFNVKTPALQLTIGIAKQAILAVNNNIPWTALTALEG
jgi:hypothetical protein